MGIGRSVRRWLGWGNVIEVLAELGEAGEGEGRWVDVLRVGRFEDRHGRAVEISSEDLDAYVANFEAGAAGQEVPIDRDHERKEAAGWVRGLRRVGDVVQFLPDWNELGRELVGDRLYRYVSATVDVVSQVFKAVSLVNFPAIKGLQPVELANGLPGSVEVGQYLQARVHKVFSDIADDLAASGWLSTEERVALSGAIGEALGRFVEVAGEGAGEAMGRLLRVPVPEFYMYSEGGEQSGTEEVQMSEEERAALEARIREEERGRLEAELAEQREREAELRERVRAEERERVLAEMAERQAAVEFAAQVCSGEQALSERPEDVVEVLMRVPAEVRGDVERLLSAARAPMGEIGSEREGRGELRELPAEYAEGLDSGELELGDLANPMLGLEGKPEEYDLSRWQE